MTDLSKTIEAKSDQLNADDILAGPITVKITKVSLSSTPEQPISINYEGDNGKPYKPGKSMRRVLVNCWGKDGQSYVGRSLTLYREPTVKFGGLEVGGIRISHMSHIKEPIVMALTASKANKKPFTVKPLVVKADDAEYLALVKAGESAAAEGLDKFTEWGKSLTAAQKEKVKAHLGAMTVKAKAVVLPEPAPEPVDGPVL